MGCDTKGIRVPDLKEADLCIGLAHGSGGSRLDGIGGYDSRSDFLEANSLALP